MSRMMLHGLGDCTPEHNCGCLNQLPIDEKPCAECERLSAAVRRVRELHRESNGSLSALYPDPICECGKDYPCPTRRILDGPARLHNEGD